MADPGISFSRTFLTFVVVGGFVAALVLRRQCRRRGIRSLQRTAWAWGLLGIVASVFFQVGPSVMSGTVIEHSRRSPEEFAELTLYVSIAACIGAILIREAPAIARFIFAAAAIAMSYTGATSFMGLWLLLAPVELLLGLPNTVYEMLHGGRQATITLVSSVYDALIPLYCIGACISAGLTWAIPGDVLNDPENLDARDESERCVKPDKA